MVVFNTSHFGTLEVEEGRVLHFKNGLVGFPEVKRYVLLDYQDTALKWLQAVDDPDVAFIVTEPRNITPEYSLEPDPVARKALELEDGDDLAVLVIVRIEGKKVIANLNGPLVLNSKKMLGMQVVVANNRPVPLSRLNANG